MRNSLAAQTGATPRESLAEIRGRAAKADMKAQEPASGLRDVAAEAIRALGKQSAAASDIGIHEGRLSHKLKDGSLTLAQLEALGPTFAAKFGESLVEQFGALVTPQQRARQQVREMRRALDELDQFLEHIA